MDAGALAVFIPVVAIGGFFTWLIVLALSKAYMEKLRAHGSAGAAAGAGDRVVVLEGQVSMLNSQVADLAERLDFAERMLAERRERKLGGGQSEDPHGNL